MISLSRLRVCHSRCDRGMPYTAALEPARNDAHQYLGTAYLQLRRYAEAVKELKLGIRQDDDGKVHYPLAKAYQALGRKDEAAAEAALKQPRRVRVGCGGGLRPPSFAGAPRVAGGGQASKSIGRVMGHRAPRSRRGGCGKNQGGKTAWMSSETGVPPRDSKKRAWVGTSQKNPLGTKLCSTNRASSKFHSGARGSGVKGQDQLDALALDPAPARGRPAVA
jgi:hypothetical protein